MKRIDFKDSAFGWDGLTTFIFSNIIILVTLGAFLFWLIFRTLHVAITAKTCSHKDGIKQAAFKTILIAGLCLENNLPTEAFKTRLKRVMALQERLPETDKHSLTIIILGGVTGGNQISEAQAGANYLIEHGMNRQQILLEQQSRHTLENMQHARSLLRKHLNSERSFPENVAIITSRFHLYRILTLAKGLNMTLKPVAAEDSFSVSTLALLRVIKEAYYLHWYWSGKLWVFMTSNQKSKARIS